MHEGVAAHLFVVVSQRRVWIGSGSPWNNRSYEDNKDMSNGGKKYPGIVRSFVESAAIGSKIHSLVST
jgi:hypothetical protein